ncbi:MAG: HPr kinase/phosphorylase [Paracoccaceae bacterium]
MSTSPLILHATTIAAAGQGALISGASGSGKSSLALQLIALGAQLVSDDRTQIERDGDRLIASVPTSISGVIEARGIGILRATAAGPTALSVIIDLDQTEAARFPPLRHRSVLDVALPLLHKVENSAWPAALLQYLTAGRTDPT